jgi:predicted adenine nucleotide alpha hydrolase (AANH) superfamily ATPase
MILLHTCCADCCLKAVHAIREQPGCDGLTVRPYFYNPNIHPQTEFTARQLALQQVCRENGLDPVVENWTPGEYFSVMRGLSGIDRADRSRRCPRCWALRLGRAFAYAVAHGYEGVATTMITSRYMDRARIVSLGNGLARVHGIRFIEYPTEACDIATKGFYKQNYCGCVWSLLERLTEKYMADGDTHPAAG